MKKKIFIILLLFVIVCTGCTANYNLKINEDLSVEETITALETDEYYKKFERSSKELVMNNAVYLHSKYIKENKYKSEVIERGIYTGKKYTKVYKNLDEYFKKSILYKQYYEDYTYTKNGDNVTIMLDKKLNPNGNSIDRYYVEDGIVSIELPFKAIDSNADKIEKNKYIWNVNSIEGDKIYISFKAKKKITKEEMIKYVSISLGVIFALIVIIVLYNKIFVNHNKNNEI